MANIGRAYCRIMPTVAALLRDILQKKKREENTGRPRGPGSRGRQMSRMSLL